MKDELKKLEALLRDLLDDDENFHIILDASPFMLWLTVKTFTVYINKSWLKFTGRTLHQELGEGRFENIHPDDLDFCLEAIDIAFHSQITYEIKYRLLHNSGEYRWILEQGNPIFTTTGEFRGFVGGCVDIHNQKSIENQLRVSEERYRRLFETARDGILILDSETGEITDVNPFLEQLLGYSKEEFLGKKLWEVGPFKNTKASKEMFKLLQKMGYVRYEDLPLEAKDGRLIEAEFVSNAYIAAEIRVIQCNIRDISERKRADAADKALSFLEQEKLKTSFIADVTHELRTPLAIIKGNVELALRDKKTVQKETFRAINIEVNHLAEMLSDLAILTTENENFHKKLTTQKVTPSEVILQVVERLQTVSTSKNIKLLLTPLPDASILGDKAYLDKLFSNIISNGILYSKENGVVTISGEVSKKNLIITVADAGVGISKDNIHHIFERFYRTEEAKISNREGTGLGLAISKWIVEAHKGQIGVTSSLGKGTTFTITLPLFD